MGHTLLLLALPLLTSQPLAVAWQATRPAHEPSSGWPPIPTSPPQASVVEARLREEDRRIYAALEKAVSEVVFQEVPFEQVVEWLTDRLHVNVQVDWTGLLDAGIERDQPVTLNLRNLPAERVLRAILAQVGHEIRVAFEVRDGVLLIATQEKLMSEQVTRAYPVRDLLLAQAERLQRRQWSADTASGSAASAAELAKATSPDYREQLARRSATTRPASAPSDVDERFVAEAERHLELLLLTTVEPDTWRENGGLGAASVYNGVLVVRQPRAVQHEVEHLLADLRATGAGESATSQPAVPK